MKPPLLASRTRVAVAAAACGLSFLAAACSSGPAPAQPTASPPATTVPLGGTTDKGRRTLVPSAIGQLAPEDVPTAPAGGR